MTFSHCVPTVLQMMLDSEQGRCTDLTGWKMLLGGSALTLSLAQRASARGISVHCGYGMSESCPLLSITHLSTDLLAQPMAQQLPLRIDAGVPLALVDLRIVDSEGRGSTARWCEPGRNRGARALAEPGLPARTGARRGAVAGWLDAYR